MVWTEIIFDTELKTLIWTTTWGLTGQLKMKSFVMIQQGPKKWKTAQWKPIAPNETDTVLQKNLTLEQILANKQGVKLAYKYTAGVGTSVCGC